MKIQVDKVKINKKIVFIASLFFMFFSFYLFGDLTNTSTIEGLKVELYPLSTPLKVGDRSVLQVLVFDEQLQARKDLNVEITLLASNAVGHQIEQKLAHVENGLYETNVQFFHSGNWEALVNVSKGSFVYEKKFQLFVER
ncbi:hypothetical protein H1D32_17615 [Anaerobacillus sp. CMMVII]|uniref:FixH family protein n=1 Tax=Anaerobacillus sp. CMMVII TaxID=2755588 RepID=UPI0021B7E5CF|nr:FixH family protein [Anaerobacillus sp. CMMVII]MCT8139365.1 hypothetical protein [Anaerobacillus sp. CMMVII]